MYETFAAGNNGAVERTTSYDDILDVSDNIKGLFQECGGYLIQYGLYRIHTPQSSIHWSILLGDYFPSYREKIIPFGFDWMGRQFVVNKGQDNVILVFDPATLEGFEYHQNVMDFHNRDLVIDKNNILSETFFNQLREHLGIMKISFQDCAGHKRPLFLSGTDDLSNFEIVDMEVYWDLQNQIYNQIKNLPPGTKINSIKLEKPK